MKKTITLLFATMLLISSVSNAQVRGRIAINNNQIEKLPIKIAKSSKLKAETLTPVVYTNETDFLAAIKNDYFLDEFDDCVLNTREDTINRTIGNYNYKLFSSPNLLFENDKSISGGNASDTMHVRNSGASVFAFGGFFFNTDISGTIVKTGDAKIIVGDYEYLYTTADSTTFVGFVFPEPVSDVLICNPNYDAAGEPVFLSMDHFYWGTGESTPTTLKTIEKNELSVYPNPTSDFINLASAKNVQSVVITNVLGNIVWSGSADQFPLNVSNFEKGIYVVKITSTSGLKSEKIIVK